MGNHTHKKGGVMLSYRYMRMDMSGARDGTNDLSPEQIATTVPNTFAGQPGQPPTLRVVPTEMTMEMHMVGAMYAPTDRLTLMAMGIYQIKDMDHITFQGGMGTNRLGTFSTRSSGIGDTKVGGLYSLIQRDNMDLIGGLSVSLPTGSITEEDDVLTPMGMRPTLRMPYAMQLGSGTFDLHPSVTFTNRIGDFGYGAQAKAVVRLGDNSEDYALGDELHASLWASYSPAPWISLSGRVAAKTVGSIDGRDARIVAPVQTANPDNYGGETISLYGGINLVGQTGILRGQRLALEVGGPVYENLNGPQMGTDWTLTLGWQYAF